MIIVKMESEIPAMAMNAEGVKDATVQVLVGPADGSENIVMRLIRVGGGGCTPLLKHSYEEVVHIRGGRGVLVVLDDKDIKNIEVRRGMNLLLPGGIQYQFRNDSSEPLEILSVIPNRDRLPQAPLCMG